MQRIKLRLELLTLTASKALGVGLAMRSHVFVKFAKVRYFNCNLLRPPFSHSNPFLPLLLHSMRVATGMMMILLM